MAEGNEVNANIRNLQREVSEMKTTQIRHKDETLKTMQTYMQVFKDLIIDTERRHQEDRKEMKDDIKEIKQDNKDQFRKLAYLFGFLTAIGLLAQNFLFK